MDAAKPNKIMNLSTQPPLRFIEYILWNPGLAYNAGAPKHSVCWFIISKNNKVVSIINNHKPYLLELWTNLAIQGGPYCRI